MSSGLVVVAHMMQSPDGKCMGFLPFEEEGTAPVVRLSDAESEMEKRCIDCKYPSDCAAKDAEIERLNRENNELGARIGREINIENKQQAERIKELEAERGESQYCAGCNDAAKTIEKQAAALKLARDALSYYDAISSTLNFNFDKGAEALAAIDALGEVK